MNQPIKLINMDSVENMQDFNIPSIDHDNIGVSDHIFEHSITTSTSDENKQQETTVQGTDSEALSSLLMLSKSNDQTTPKPFGSEVLFI